MLSESDALAMILRVKLRRSARRFRRAAEGRLGAVNRFVTANEGRGKVRFRVALGHRGSRPTRARAWRGRTGGSRRPAQLALLFSPYMAGTTFNDGRMMIGPCCTHTSRTSLHAPRRRLTPLSISICCGARVGVAWAVRLQLQAARRDTPQQQLESSTVQPLAGQAGRLQKVRTHGAAARCGATATRLEQ